MHAAEFAQALSHRGYTVRQQGNEFRAQCPAHGGEHLNLQIIDGTDAVIVTCHSHGCSFKEIVSAAGLAEADLWFEPRRDLNGHGLGETKIYPYRDEEGKVLYEVRRTPDKQFTMWLPGAEKPGIGSTRRVLFGLPELLATQPGDLVVIVEGEKCALAVASLGIAATTNPNGAGKWRPEYSQWLKEHLPDRVFLVLGDNDAEGKRHALEICDSLAAGG